MKTSVKRLVKLFNLNLKSVVKKDEHKRWVAAIMQLTNYDYGVLEMKLNLIKKREQEKPPLYYLEAVRRSLLDEEHRKMKNAPMAQSVKDVMKGMFN